MSIVYGVLLYTAATVFMIGILYKVVRFSYKSAPPDILVMPPPMSKFGVVKRVLHEIILFVSLSLSDKWLWLFALLFHGGLMLTLLCHTRYFLSPDIGAIWYIVIIVQPVRIYAAIAMLIGLITLLVRRLTLEQVHYITATSDVAVLFLFLIICVSGLLTKLIIHTDIIALKQFLTGLLIFSLHFLPSDILLLLHLLCATMLVVIFPISKLLHVPITFSRRSKKQYNDTLKQRYIRTS